MSSIGLVQVNDIATKVVNRLRDLVTNDVQLELRLDPTLEPIEADVFGIEQVIVNLVLNARQAMPNRGSIALETAMVDVLKEISRPGSHVAAGRYVRLTVEDSGCGMTPAVVERLLDQSYIAEPSSQGPGLGLSTCLRVVRGHGGEMTIDSEPGRGTRVGVYLPRRYPIELERLPQGLRDSAVHASQ